MNPINKLLFICVVTVFMVSSSAVFSQISEGGVPPSFNYPQTLRSAAMATKVPIDFYIEDLRETDEWQARDGVPMPVAKLIAVDYTMENSGYYSQLPGGENIWRLHLTAKGAVAVMLYYSDFFIPEGGRLFIYRSDKSQVLGAYTHRTNPPGGLFATEFVGGDELILEYVMSETSEEKPRIAISDIGYGYNTAALREFCGITTRAQSGDCMVSINCEEGQAWQNEKKSVCYTNQRIGSRSFICTGTLINNTAVDFKPLILTATHCAADGSNFSSEKDMKQWLFYFNKEYVECNDKSKTIPNTMIGCTLLANTGMGGGSDGLLVLLNNDIPENYDVFFSGWDRSGDAASSGVCIHHPNGDYKKISTFSEPVKAYTFLSSEFNGDTQAHWNAVFKATANGYGITEVGSSGSALFNENKLVVGTLTGGNSSCDYPRGVNLYGRLNYHWDKYQTDSTTRMDVWLDPLNTGVKTLAGRFRTELKPAPLNLKAVNMGQSISLTWDAPKSGETPTGYNIYRNNLKIAENTSLIYIDNEPLVGSITYSVSAVYENGEESGFISATLLLIKHKAPFDLKAERQGNAGNQIELHWKAPVYEQTIYWGSLSPAWMFGYEERMPFYYGQIWSADEIKPLHNNTIKAVQFIPVTNNSYDIYITQGDYSYRQPVESSSLKHLEMNTINLNTPFVIDGSIALIVSIYTSQVGTDYPAICDEGPAIGGKGNICSSDGIEWSQLYDGEESGNYDYNFIITAVISSESANLTDHAISKRNTVKLTGDHPVIQARKDRNRKASSPVSANIDPTILPRKTAQPFDDHPVSLRNSAPAAFPEITKYRIYRSGSFFKEIGAPVTSCTDSYVSNYMYYQVSAFYDQIESEKSDTAYIHTVNNDFIDASIRIYPTPFKDFIMLQGYEYVSRVEALSISGKVFLVVNNPNQQINTSSLPPGLYFFRIYGANNNSFVIKAVKR